MPNGRSYEGEWKNGKMHGSGKFIWEDGRVYQGYFKKENILWINDMDLEHLSGQMAEFTKENGNMIKDMEKPCIRINTSENFNFCG